MLSGLSKKVLPRTRLFYPSLAFCLFFSGKKAFVKKKQQGFKMLNKSNYTRFLSWLPNLR